MDEKIKTGPLRFHPNNHYGEGIIWLANQVAVWHHSKVSVDFQQVLGHEVFSAKCSLNQPKATCICICSINQSIYSISVLLLFLYCLRIFISRSYVNCSTRHLHGCFQNFDYDQWAINCQHDWKERLKICKAAIFESDFLESNKDIAVQSHENVQTLVHCMVGARCSPYTHTDHQRTYKCPQKFCKLVEKIIIIFACFVGISPLDYWLTCTSQKLKGNTWKVYCSACKN